MRRHLRWVVPLVLAPLVYIGAMLAVATLDPASADLPTALWALGLFAVAVLGPLALLIVSVAQGLRVRRESRRSRGILTRAEQRQEEGRAAQHWSWENARALRRTLLAGHVPTQIQQWDLAPYPAEHFFAAVPMTYARYYGTTVTHSSISVWAVGRPGFVVGAMAIGAISNAARRRAAIAEARDQWREWQTAYVLVSNHRLAVRTTGGWLSFDYPTMTAVYPGVVERTLVCQFQGAEPLLLQGDHAPIASIMSIFAVHGQHGLAHHPAFGALD